MSDKTPLELRVLVADDDQSIRQLLGTIMDRQHMPVDLAGDGMEAVGLLKKHTYSVILLDLMMPRLDGFGVIGHLKEHPPAHKPVVLVISAYADQRFKEVDPDIVAGVVRKPFDVEDLGNLVRLCAEGFENAVRRGNLSSDETVRVLSTDRMAQLKALRETSSESEH